MCIRDRRVAATLVNAWAERGDDVTLTPTYSSKGTCFYPLSDKVKPVSYTHLFHLSVLVLERSQWLMIPVAYNSA